MFGNDIFGAKPGDRSTITVYMILSNGASGNGCKNFKFNSPSAGSVPGQYSIGNWEDFVVTKLTDSAGGREKESLEEIRFAIPYHYKRQNRLVTEDDFRSIILNDFRNVDTLNVWGGERHFQRDYGKIFISIKPKYSDRLTDTEKNNIKETIIRKNAVIGMEPVFINPEYVNVSLVVTAAIDQKRTTKSAGQVSTEIVSKIMQYNDTRLNVFENFLSEVKLMSTIMEDDLIISCFSEKVINKDYVVIPSVSSENTLYFGNSLEKGIRSSIFTYGNERCYYGDEDGNDNLFIFKENGTKFVLGSMGSINYEIGNIKFLFNQYSTAPDDTIRFYASPSKPDVYSSLNNIVRITEATCNISFSATNRN